MFTVNRILSLSAFGLISLITPNAQANDRTDFYFQDVLDRYYQFPQNARTFGMAGSSTLTSIDSSAIIGNPAGTGFMRKGEFSGTYSNNTISGDEFPTNRPIELNADTGTTLMEIPLGQLPDQTPEFGNLGLGWHISRASWDDDSFDTHERQMNIIGSYAKAIDDTLSVGYGLSWFRDKLQSNDLFNYPMANGFRHTVGVLYHPLPEFLVGSTVWVGHGRHHDMFEPQFQGVSKTFQVGVGVGAQYQVMEATTLAANVDYSHLKTNGDVIQSIPSNFAGGDETGNIFNARIGVEQRLHENFVARAGYRFAGLASYNYARSELSGLEGSAYYNAFSLGAGVNFDTTWHYVPEVRLDYGVEYRAAGNDDWEHVVTISAPFDVCPPA